MMMMIVIKFDVNLLFSKNKLCGRGIQKWPAQLQIHLKINKELFEDLIIFEDSNHREQVYFERFSNNILRKTINLCREFNALPDQRSACQILPVLSLRKNSSGVKNFKPTLIANWNHSKNTAFIFYRLNENKSEQNNVGDLL